MEAAIIFGVVGLIVAGIMVYIAVGIDRSTPRMAMRAEQRRVKRGDRILQKQLAFERELAATEERRAAP